MYYGKKKAITITIIVILLILILGGVGAYLFLATDLFKPNEEMFFKYIGQAIEEAKFTDNTQLTAISNLKEEVPYTIVGELSLDFNSEENSQKYKELNNAKVGVSAKVDKENEKEYAMVDLYSNSNKIFTVEYARNKDIYALNSAEIANAYIGIENKNVQTLLKKLGIEVKDDTNLLPNKIENNNSTELFKLTNEEKNHIIETYSKFIKENISTDSFTKENNIAVSRDGVIYNATGYRLNLTGTQLKELEIAALNTLKQDSITLNLISTKAKILGLDSNYTEINKLTKIIDNIINNINNQNTQLNDVSIIVYVENGKVITTEILFKNYVKYTFYTTKQNTSVERNIIIDNLGTDMDADKLIVKFTENKTPTKSIYESSINIDNKQKYSIYLENVGSANEEKLDTTLDVTIENEKETYTLSYKQNMKFVEEIKDFVELNRNNCAVLNDYTAEQVQGLVGSLVNRIVEVIQEKAAVFGMSIGGYSVEPKINGITTAQ